MAKEITEAGQIVVYGGPNLTLLGSTLGNAVTSILTREGTGGTRGWKLFDPTKADFLNTKKQLVDGDFVLVNAKVLPMDFPIKVGAIVTPILDVYEIPAQSGTVPFEIRQTLTRAGIQYASQALVDAAAAAVTGTVSWRIQKRGVAAVTTLTTLSDYNTALAAIPDSEYASGVNTLYTKISITSNVAGKLILQTK